MIRTSPKLLHLFLMLAFVLAGVSPACKFISGEKSFMDICFSDGSLKRVEVPAEYAPLLAKVDKTQKQDQGGKHKDKSDCAFCFAQSSLTKGAPAAPVTLVNPPRETLATGAGTFALRGLEPTSFHARGPPVLS